MSATETIVVAIGRNEGERLRLCLSSLAGLGLPLAYADPGSTDGSVPLARARNKGFACALEICPKARFVQFFDGDCELDPGWLDRGVAPLDACPRTAAVCGGVRERRPEASIYNRLCDLEWRRDPGPIQIAGGRFLVRAAS